MYKSMAKFREIFNDNHTRSTGEEYYRWKIESNPYTHGLIYLDKRQGDIIGSTSITPKKIAILGESCLSAEIGDTFTHPNYRRQGVFTRGVTSCTKYGISKGLNVIYGTPNLLSLTGYEKKLGYSQCPFAKVKYMCKYLNVQPLERIALRKLKKYWLSSTVAHLYFRLLSFQSWLQKKEPTSSELTLKILPIEEFHWDVDGLWGYSREKHIFFTIRDKTYLNWRFFANPDKYTFLAAIENDTCLGYVVIKISNSHGLLIGTICDFVTWEDRMDIFHPLLQRAEKKLFAMGVHYIQVMCAEETPYFQRLYHSGYVIRSSKPVIIFAGTEAGKQIIMKNARWHFTFADSDNI